MAKTLDLNRIKRPTLPLILCDKARTTINVTTPEEAMVRELQESLPALQETLSRNDAQATAASFDLLGRLLSFNLEGIKITGTDLVGKYNLTLEHLVAITSAYVAFIEELSNEKN